MRPFVVLLIAGAVVVIGAGAYLVNKLGDNAAEVRGGSGARVPSGGTAGPAPVLTLDAPSVALDCAKPTGNAALVDSDAVTIAAVCGELTKIGGVKNGVGDVMQTRAVLDRMIDDVLVKRAVASSNVTVTDAEITAALEARGVLALAPGPDQDLAMLREQMRARLGLEKLAKVDAVTEREVDAELAAGAPGIDRGAGVRVEGWIIRVPANADAATRAKAEAAARAVAKTPSDAVAQQHGMTKLAPFVVGASGLEPELEAAASGLAQGAVSGAVTTKVGIAVIKKLEDVEGTSVDDAALRPRVRKALETRRAQTATRELIARLRRAAHIEYLVSL